MSARRGATLVEAVVALTTGSMLLTALLRLMMAAQRLDASTRDRLAARHAARDAAGVVRAELAWLDARDGDVTLSGDTAITLRAVRGGAVVCGVRTRAVVVADSLYAGARQPDPTRDSLLAYDAGLPPWRAGAAWITAALAGTGSSPCDDGSRGRRLDLPPGADARWDSLAPGAPLRIFESVTYRAYVDGSGTRWLGIRGAGGGAISPVAGPLLPGGFRVVALDSGFAQGPLDSSTRALRFAIGGLGRRTADSMLTVVGVRPE